MNTRLFRLSLFMLLLAFPLSEVTAATFVALKEESASVRQEVTGDLYATSNAVIIAAPVRGDIFAAGSSVDISGSSDASVFAVGEGVTISGEVTDDVRVAGVSIALTSKTAHDVFAAGSTISLGPQSFVGGDAYLAASDVTIEGTINGTLRVAGERVTITKTAIIRGDVITYQNKPVIEDGATIGGKTTTIAPATTEQQSNRQDGIWRLVQSVISRAILAFALIWIAPLMMTTMRNHAVSAPVRSGLLGLAVIILCIPLTIIIAMTGVGLPVAALVFAASMLLIIIGIGSSIVLLGSYIMKLITTKDPSASLSWQHALVGGVATALIMLAGSVGFLILFIVFVIALGATILTANNIFHA